MTELAAPLMIDIAAESRSTHDLLKKFGHVPGVYVVKPDPVDFDRVYRFGKKRDCVLNRIRQHEGERGKYDNITGDLMPYTGVYAWLLKNWPSYRVDMAELALFGALNDQAVSPYPSPTRNTTDKSNFLLADSFDWDRFRHRVNNELNLIASLGE